MNQDKKIELRWWVIIGWTSVVLIGLCFIGVTLISIMGSSNIEILRITQKDSVFTITAGDQTWTNLSDIQCDSILVHELQICTNLKNQNQHE